ncbi:MAG: hypothetical protein DME25_02225 [Verrucomicrobia bacterium]|nr:MAG: hypothetical protein DME25_02225 [Verrucomicrobiota bacterium]
MSIFIVFVLSLGFRSPLCLLFVIWLFGEIVFSPKDNAESADKTDHLKAPLNRSAAVPAAERTDWAGAPTTFGADR